MRTIKYIQVFTGLFLMFCMNLDAQIEDLAGCKDHAMFNRMPNTFITECTENFDMVEIYLSRDDREFKEGKKTYISYTYNYDSNVKPPSFYEIVKNYENAIVKKGGKKIFYGPPSEIGIATLYIKSGEKEIWIAINDYGGIGEGQYALTILEIEAMKQEIIANEILDALNRDGFIALYLNFASGKASIEPDSDKQIDEIATMMKSNTSLKISVEGHTDNVGGESANQTLSEDRAKAVVNALVSKGIDKSRLVSKGWGQTKPIADNRTEDGRAKNRRVEIVKL
jgi:OmpA-OmpF porin, OOP family